MLAAVFFFMVELAAGCFFLVCLATLVVGVAVVVVVVVVVEGVSTGVFVSPWAAGFVRGLASETGSGTALGSGPGSEVADPAGAVNWLRARSVSSWIAVLIVLFKVKVKERHWP